MRVFVVREGEEDVLSAILLRMKADDAAIADGRVFVGRKRVHDATIFLHAGEDVRVAHVKPRGGEARILAEGDGFVAAEKPAGIPTIADHGGVAHAFITEVARALDVAPEILHATSRLDRGVSGIVIFALTERARDELREARELGLYERLYVALAERAPDPRGGVWSESIGRAKNPNLRAVSGPDAVKAVTHYETIAVTSSSALLALAPITGRTHQLRVHASHAQAPLLGDRDYGGPANLTLDNGARIHLARIALHCARVRLHLGGNPVVVESEVPDELRKLHTKLGGADDDWEKAVTCTL